MGIRAQESNKRAKRGAISKRRKWTIYKPIFNWETWEIWEYIRENSLPYCEIYDWGFKRIGCTVCPFLCNPNQTLLNQHKIQWPKHYVAFEKAMLKLWDDREWWRQTTRRYAMLPEEFLNNWYHGN